MNMIDPVYGELLKSKEVSELTGFTPNQIRYFKQKPEKSPLPLLKLRAGTFFRKADVLLYLEREGRQEEKYIVPTGVKTAPLIGEE